MAGLDSAPQPSEKEDPRLVSRNARYGLWLFFVYLCIYGGFMALSAFAPPRVMAIQVIGGVNLAVLYGFGLIGAAWVLAIIYMYLCQRAIGPSAAVVLDTNTQENRA